MKIQDIEDIMARLEVNRLTELKSERIAAGGEHPLSGRTTELLQELSRQKCIELLLDRRHAKYDHLWSIMSEDQKNDPAFNDRIVRQWHADVDIYRCALEGWSLARLENAQEEWEDRYKKWGLESKVLIS